MLTSRADVGTEHASRYLQQLCKHWAHKFVVEFDPSHGSIELPAGRTVLDADASTLRIAVSAEGQPDLERLAKIVEDHIRHFGFREELAFRWSHAADG